MKKVLKSLNTLICAGLVIVCLFCTFVTNNNSISTPIRDVELKDERNLVDSNFQLFDNYELEIEEERIYFTGYDTLMLSDLYELDLVSESNDENVLTRYNCSFDYENGIVSLSVSMIFNEETSIIDTIYGVIIMDLDDEFDVIFDCGDGDTLLLSELEEAGMIDNCGFFSKLKKVWNTTAGKIGTIATVATCAVVGVVCAVVPGGQLVTAACIGVAVGAIGGAVTAGVATYIEEGLVDWNAVLCYAGAGAVVGGVTAVASYKITSAIKQLFPKSSPSNQVKGFDSYSSFKKEYGSASNYVNDGQWHHIVEQNTVSKGINPAQSVYNSQNTVAIPKDLHVKISSYYSSYNPAYGMTNRAYINTLTYNEQYKIGIEILSKYATEMGITPFWL